MRSSGPVGVLLTGALALAGCTDDQPAVAPSRTPSTSTSSTATASPAPPTPDSASPGAAAPIASSPVDPAFVDSAIFMTPSRAHGCLLVRRTLTKATVSCQGSWSFERPPPPPGGCGGFGDWGGYLDLEERPEFSCASDTFLGDHPTLEYGRSVQLGNILCTSAPTGVTCRNTANGRGFVVSRTRYSFSPPPRSGPPDLADLSTYARSASFASPSRNIGCVLDGTPDDPVTVVTCKIESFSYPPPPRPSDCQGGDWGGVVVMGAEPYFQCGGDEVRTSGYPVLPYGRSIAFGSATCTSEQAGVICVDVRSKRRMSLSKERYSLS